MEVEDNTHLAMLTQVEYICIIPNANDPSLLHASFMM